MLRGDYVVALGQDGREVWLTNYPNGSWCFAWKAKARDVKAIPNSSRRSQMFQSEGWDLS